MLISCIKKIFVVLKWQQNINKKFPKSSCFLNGKALTPPLLMALPLRKDFFAASLINTHPFMNSHWFPNFLHGDWYSLLNIKYFKIPSLYVGI